MKLFLELYGETFGKIFGEKIRENKILGFTPIFYTLF